MNYKEAKLRQIVRFQGNLCEVIGTSQGDKVIYLLDIEPDKCPHCEKYLEKRHHAIIERSPLFQENVYPVETIS